MTRERGARNHLVAPKLTERTVRAWAKAHRERTGGWPRVHEGPIPEAPGETWSCVNAALVKGSRGLPGGVTLFAFLNGRPPRAGR